MREYAIREVACALHVQTATYTVDEVSDAEFIEANQEFARVMCAVPGLLAKIWLEAPDGSTHGGVYLWEDREAHEAFVVGDLWASVRQDGSLSRLDSRKFSVMEDLTRATQPGLEVIRSSPRG